MTEEKQNYADRLSELLNAHSAALEHLHAEMQRTQGLLLLFPAYLGHAKHCDSVQPSRVLSVDSARGKIDVRACTCGLVDVQSICRQAAREVLAQSKESEEQATEH